MEIDKLKDASGALDADAIMKIIPYGKNFLMIDKVTKLDKLHIQATMESRLELFDGHFDGFPIMPGALIIEGMGQAGTLLVRYNLEDHESKDILAYKIKEAKFSAPSFPGDKLTYELELVGMDERGAMLRGAAKNGERKVTEVTMMLSIVDKKAFRERFAK